MGKIKKALILVFLVVASCCCLTSCSCSFGRNRNGDGTGGGTDGAGGDGTPPQTEYYTVSVSFNNESAGSYSSSTGSNSHESGTSPVYTITPYAGWCIDTIKIDGASYYSSAMNGYLYTPKEVTIASISSNVTLEVKFIQAVFDVTYNIENSGYASSAGGEVIPYDQDADGKYLGGTSAIFKVVPHEGYIIHTIYLNNNFYYKYTSGDTNAATNMDVIIPAINEDVVIKVAFYKLEDIQAVLSNYHNGTNSLGQTGVSLLSESDALVSYAVDGYNSGDKIPNGAAATLILTPKVGAYITEVSVSVDGGVTFMAPFNASQYQIGNGYSYDPTSNGISFDIFNNLVKLRVYTQAETSDIIIYDYDGRSTSARTQINLHSYYILQDWMADYEWFYSKDAAYQESNTHTPLEVIETQDSNGGKVYAIYLDPDYISEAKDAIVLIYKSK